MESQVLSPVSALQSSKTTMRFERTLLFRSEDLQNDGRRLFCPQNKDKKSEVIDMEGNNISPFFYLSPTFHKE